MFQKLQEFEKKYQELEKQLSQPDIVQNQKEYQKILKERSRLSPLVNTFLQYQKTCKDIEDNKHILNEEIDEGLRQLAKEDLTLLESQKTKLENELKTLLLPKDSRDEKNTLLEIRAGTGGEEAALFASDLFRMYSRYAERKGWRVELMDSNYTGIGGLKEIIVLITGNNVFSDLKYESGVHRVQRVPKTESSGRIHTSAVTVAVVPEADDIEIDIEEKDLKIEVFRSSGPGGQGVNTTDSAVRLTHIPSGMVVVCRDERSQIKNRAKGLKILKSRLLEAKQREQEAQERAERKSQIGSGDRSEKIRTYNFPQSRVTDHRIGLTLHQLDQILDGNLDEIIMALRTHYQTEAIKETL
ncbi:MAG: peptide chain release factor 1 [Deltaproteobacteria bacterium RIFCSPLOWO2_02_FULL_50_16]|nr:MAG: peptide chain release factor 1 [Deltaproteobacteria bacterium GWA2_50_8]OGQ29491.1 MAG: peptide chain release factor 1 [Deltaproteobacteria bacterium RIFCSPHIGHO2_02_FULL_50_15]OGQ58311.1 MAG: peptide chain release factor 1 [Deltaproteobacteria bacterium RIFCSPLOWO2_02_FULL_50_16]OGQ66623.1 MAG: peptide chain release factor 1 [Deltaproteobacteria bacterium RIFCSPLOWO2_12_FULL_50_11]